MLSKQKQKQNNLPVETTSTNL